MGALSKMNMNEILDDLAGKLSKYDSLELVSFYFDEAELSPNKTSFPCIQFQPMAWKKGRDCDFERELQIRIYVNTRTERDAIIELYNYEEIVRNAMDEIIKDLPNSVELLLIGGTQPVVLAYMDKDADSYKSQKTLFGSGIAIRYLLRY